MNHLVWSLKQIRIRLFESLLIIVAIGLGVAALCSVASLFLAINRQLESQMSLAQVIYVTPSRMDRSGLFGINPDDSPVRLLGRIDDEEVTLTLEDLRLLQTEVPAVKHALAVRWSNPRLADAGTPPSVDARTPEGQMRLREWYEANSVYAVFTFPAALEAEGLALESGSNLAQSDLDQQRLVCVIGKNLARRLFGESNPVGRQLRLVFSRHPVSITVIGVLGEIEADRAYGSDHSVLFSSPRTRLNDSLFLPFTTWDVLQQSGGSTHPDGTAIDRILVVPRDDVDFEAALSSIRSYVESKYGLGLSVTSPLDNYNLEGVDSVMVALAAFGSVALMIAAINALNLMIARALRRTKSFGISAALGLSRRGIFIQFLTECLLLSIFGLLIGMAISVAFAKAFTIFITRGAIEVTVPVEIWVLGLAVAIMTTLAFGLYPALEASRTNVVDALRTE